MNDTELRKALDKGQASTKKAALIICPVVFGLAALMIWMAVDDPILTYGSNGAAIAGIIVGLFFAIVGILLAYVSFFKKTEKVSDLVFLTPQQIVKVYAQTVMDAKGGETYVTNLFFEFQNGKKINLMINTKEKEVLLSGLKAKLGDKVHLQ